MSVSWERRVVPQWARSVDPQIRFVSNTSLSKSSVSSQSLNLREDELLQKAIQEFSLGPTVGLAADALRFGLRGGVANSQLASAAKFILDQPTGVPDGLRQLALATANNDFTELSLQGSANLEAPVQAAIHDIRLWLSRFPRDALSWLDLGRLHAAAGNNASARKAVVSALTLQPNSLPIIRGTSRFFLHARLPDLALATLERSNRSETDPWLMAGHIAVSSILGKTSKFSRKARRLLEQNTLHPRDLSELASSLATLELEAGSNKEARKLFNLSLREPNENSLAQVEWAGKLLNVRPDLPSEWLANPVSAEAGYYHAIFENQFDDALARALRWHSDEPFASRPMIAASFITAISGRLEDAVGFARIGLVTEPSNAMLLNNLAFALGAQGKLALAEQLIAKIATIEEKRPSGHTLANLGMLSYLRGEHALGSELYDLAEKAYRRDHRFEEAAATVSFQAHFARKVDAPHWQELVNRARAAVEESRSRIVQTIFTKLTDAEIKDTSEPINNAIPSRKWQYDLEKNVLTFEKRAPMGRT